jgi:hypothetical protein
MRDRESSREFHVRNVSMEVCVIIELTMHDLMYIHHCEVKGSRTRFFSLNRSLKNSQPTMLMLKHVNLPLEFVSEKMRENFYFISHHYSHKFSINLRLNANCLMIDVREKKYC